MATRGRWVRVAGPLLALGLSVVAAPAQADLFDPLQEAAGTISETVETVTAPVDEATPLLPPPSEQAGDPVIGTVEEFIDPVTEPIDRLLPSQPVDPSPSPADRPRDEPVAASPTPIDRPFAEQPPPSPFPTVDGRLAEPSPSGSTGPGPDVASVLVNLEAPSEPEPHSNPAVKPAAPTPDTRSAWLGWLAAWLSNTFTLLMAAPIRALELLIRALLTAGSGLVAPASLLVAVGIFALLDPPSKRGRFSLRLARRHVAIREPLPPA
ncbi:MAG: hypothetical protein ACT4OP_03260 [Actinomycetota bacterium]